MSQFNTFYIPMTDEGDAAERLNAFLRSHRVLAVRTRDFPEGWGFCVEWMAGNGPADPPGTGASFRGKVDYMKVLDPEAFKRFSEYRKRRRDIAEAEGVKPFVVMTDAQLAELAKMENPSKADLGKIEGFGEARMEKYAERLLATAEEGETSGQGNGGASRPGEPEGLAFGSPGTARPTGGSPGTARPTSGPPGTGWPSAGEEDGA